MNYLAHAYLSFREPQVLVGNMISDFVKGKKQFEYMHAIQKGIQLHRAIDTFTDKHDATQLAKSFFKADYRLYAGAFIDIVYDHFLATDENIFSSQNDLQQFVTYTYETLKNYFDILPEKFQKMFYWMEYQNWLYNYQFNWGIEKSFEGLVKRSKYLKESITAFKIFEQNYDALKSYYYSFIGDILNMVKQNMNQ